MIRTFATLAGASTLLAVPSLALAQSTNTQVILGVTNEAYASETFLGVISLFNQENTTPAANGFSSGTQGSVRSQHTGMDRSGQERTLSFQASGLGLATYGRLNAYNALTVENAFYNEANTPYFDTQTETLDPTGVPDYFDNFARAQFTDILQYGGELRAGYSARYVFRVHAVTQGNADMSSVLTFGLPGGYERFDFQYAASENPTDDVRFISTQRYVVDGDDPEEVTVQFASAITGRTQKFEDGATIFGEADFRSTVSLTGIELTDASGRIVGGWTVTSASGTSYPQAVPEPTSLAATALGGLAVLRRRRLRAKRA